MGIVRDGKTNLNHCFMWIILSIKLCHSGSSHQDSDNRTTDNNETEQSTSEENKMETDTTEEESEKKTVPSTQQDTLVETRAVIEHVPSTSQSDSVKNEGEV